MIERVRAMHRGALSTLQAVFALLFALQFALAAGGCRARPGNNVKNVKTVKTVKTVKDVQTARPGQTNIAWRQLGSWSGHGNAQTESFDSETGTLRVRWEAAAPPDEGAPPDEDATPTRPGLSFRLTAHSAISGRPLQPVVEHAGPGSGIGYVQQDPHVFYMVVESTRLSWTFTVEEAIGYP
jgi:hypothetical protein